MADINSNWDDPQPPQPENFSLDSFKFESNITDIQTETAHNFNTESVIKIPEVDENDAWDTEEPEHVIRNRIEIKPPPPPTLLQKSPEKPKTTDNYYGENKHDKRDEKYSENTKITENVSGGRRNYQSVENFERKPRNDSGNFGKSRDYRAVGDSFNRDQKPFGTFRRFSSTFRPRDAEYAAPQSFKEFVSQQDDRISPEEAVRKFAAYKLEVSLQFKRTFFDKHRTFDWFILKFHPYFRCLDKIKLIRIVRKRLNIFNNFLNISTKYKIFINFDISDTLLPFFVKLLDICLNSHSNNKIISVLECEFGRLADNGGILLKSSIKRKFDSQDLNNSSINSQVLNLAPNSVLDSRDESSPSSSSSKSHIQNNTDFDNSYSIELKNIPAKINKKLIFKILKKMTGFLRLSNYIMSVDNETYRLIATFNKSTDISDTISDIKSQFSDNPIPDYKLEINQYSEQFPIIKSVRGIWNVNKIAFECIKMAVSVIEKLDNEMLVFCGNLPILPEFDRSFKKFDPNADDFTIKEDEVLSSSESDQQSSSDENVESLVENPLLKEAKKILEMAGSVDEYGQVSDEVLRMLDTLVLYLRLVHSFDFYSFHLESHEHYMPSRIQTVYARKVVDFTSGNSAKVEKFMVEVSQKFKNFTSYLDRYEVTELKKYDKDLKDEKTELDKFMQAKLKEMRPNVWQCLACKKKFQTQEFVRKHLMSKHVPIIEAIKLNTIFFNNYFIDSQVVLEKISDDRPFYSTLEETGNISVSNLNVSQPKRRKSLLKYDNDGELDFDSIVF